ncbi:TetR/AcrR family transcriptional regulator [Pseudonocardia sp. MH-G8]|uniref:TetR/AcrR family transcriptional regulator n=1 Tax=Pseudonocardia sp. MH-G8 TaxID=1854588 RepID=UPI000B9FA8EA|nr:TetR/AcrR family transcriptional regulator [Pseudonocardia sp. MH-G8]OZM80233.1 TetR family transcriptional regulator [Pseudonocardia sp. MH-G8]
MSPKRVDHAARREEILAAAVRVFARKGFAATRIEDVAAEAGVGKGSVYLSFDSRDALLDAALAALSATSRDVLGRARSGGGPPLERLAELVRGVLAAATADPDLARVLLDLWSLGRRGDARVPLDMAALYAEYREAIGVLLAEASARGEVRADVSPAHAAVVVGAIEGCLLQWVVDPGLPIAGMDAAVVAVCLDGLAARS